MSKKDLIKIGQKYNRWEVIGEVVGESVKCRCNCGNEKEVKVYHLLDNRSKSCGCLQKEVAAKNGYNQLLKHGKTKTKLFKTWCKIRQKCSNKNCTQYKYYGLKGIKVCGEWLNFETFEKWSLENGYQEHLTIDRIDGNKNYEPNNCRWVDMFVQNNNKSNNIKIELNGVIKTLSEWCRIYGVDYKAAWGRYSRGKKGLNIFREVTE